MSNGDQGNKVELRRLQNIKDELKCLFDINLDMLCIADINYNFLKLNPAWERCLGYTCNELLSVPFLNLIHPDDILSTLDAISNLADQKEVVDHTNRYRHKDGTYRWLEWRLTQNGNLIYAAARDVTERKQVKELIKSHDELERKVQLRNDQIKRINEELQYDILIRKAIEISLRKEYQFSSAILNSSDTLIIVLNPEGKIVTFNNACRQVSGYCSEEIAEKYFWNFMVYKEDKASIKEKYKRLNNGEHQNIVQNYWFTKTGEKRLIKWTNTALMDSEGKLENIVCSGIDITEQYEAEQALKESETYYRTVFESTGTAILIADREHKISKLNSMFETLLGYSKSDLEGKDFSSFITPKSVDLMLKYHKLRQKNSVYAPQGYEITAYHKNGDIRNLICNVSIVPDSQNSIVSLTDITVQRQAEEEISYTLKFQELLLNISREFTNIVADDIDSMINWSLQLLGEFDGVDRSYVFLFSHDGSKVSNTHEWCAQGIQPQINDIQNRPILPWWMDKLSNFETINIADVANLPLEAQAEKEILESQKIKSVLAVPIIIDTKLIGFLGFDSVLNHKFWSEQSITLIGLVAQIFANAFQRKKYIKTIQESENMYRTIFENTGTAMALIDKDQKMYMANSNIETLIGYSRDELIGKRLLEYLEPNYVDVVMKNYNLRRTDPNNAPKEYGIKSIDRWGNARDLVLNVSVIPNSENEILSIRDITEQRKAEMLCKESEERFRMLFEDAPVGIIIERKGIIVAANKSYTNMFGYKDISELFGISFINLVAPNSQNETIEIIRKQEQYGELPCPRESMGLKRDGSTFPIYVVVKSINLPDSSANVVYVTDITNLKMAENDLKYQIKLQQLLLDIYYQFTRFKSDDISNIINSTLKTIGEFNGDDCSFIILFTDDGSVVNETFEWFSEGTKPIISNMKGLQSELLPWGMGKVKRFEYVYIPNNKSRSKNQIEMDYQDLSSIITVPIVYEEKLIGFLGAGTEYNTKLWPEKTIVFFKLLAQFLASVFDRFYYKKASEKLDNYYQVLFENTGAATAILDEDLTISMVNQKFERLLGYSTNEIVGKKNFRSFISEGKQELVEEVYQLRNNNPELAPREYEIAINNRFRNTVNVILTADLIPGTTKRAVSMVDISKQKEMLKILEDRLADLNRMLIRISNF